jgi:HlyD family secretion protein
MSKKSLYFLIGGVLLFIVILLLLSKKGVIGNKEQGIEVEIAKVDEMTIVETVSATGKIQPEVEVKIASEVSGEIIALPVKEGQVVKKGDLLVKINPDLYTSGYNRTVAGLSQTKAGLGQADASYKEAKASYDRSKILFDKGIISKSEWDKATAAFESANAAKQSAYYNVQSASATVNEAKDNLGRTMIYAPTDGTISLLNVELGERVLGSQMTATELLRVANLNNMEIEVDVNENDIVKINVGDSANVEVDAYLKKQFKGLVTSISNSASTTLTADQVTNFKVKVRILKESYQDLIAGKPASYSPFRPGMTATVDIITKRKANVLAVPISSVVVKADTTPVKKIVVDDPNSEENKIKPKSDKKYECVFVKSGNKSKIRIIKTGIQDDTNIEVTEGLKKGDVVIIGPYTTVTKDLNSGDNIIVSSGQNKEPKK